MCFDFKKRLRSIPHAPGVYRMLDNQGAILYIGKARDLRRRVQSYFSRQHTSSRIALMVAKIAAIDCSITLSEAEALLLESELIKAHAPKFNILFRDDKSYPHIRISHHEFPRISLYRGKVQRDGQYFGPFPNTKAVRESIQLLQKTFRLRTCEDSVYKHRSRPCLSYQINRCSAPCVGLISSENYQRDLYQAGQFLSGDHQQLLHNLTQDMEMAAAAYEFERAASLRDQIYNLRQVQETQHISNVQSRDVDIVVTSQHDELTAVVLAMVRGGRHLGERCFFPEHAKATTVPEVMSAFLAHHYTQNEPPHRIILAPWPTDPDIVRLLTAVFGSKTRCVRATTKTRRAWVQMAQASLHAAMLTRLNDTVMQDRRLDDLQTLLELDAPPTRIECIDISHNQGEGTVGSCVVYAQGAMRSKDYRRYHIRNGVRNDDYAAIAEVVKRRFRPDAVAHIMPDVLMIDGGLGQLERTRQVLADYGVLNQLTVMAIAKGPERKAGVERLWRLVEDEVIEMHADRWAVCRHLIQEIRDEAHRFALFGHRAVLAKTRKKSQLEQIPGIGAAKRRALLTRFGSVRALQDAHLDELTKVPGISKKLAAEIQAALQR